MFDEKLKSLIAQIRSKGYEKPIDIKDNESKPLSNISQDALRKISGGERDYIYLEFSKAL